jgi:hypothetical protein
VEENEEEGGEGDSSGSGTSEQPARLESPTHIYHFCSEVSLNPSLPTLFFTFFYLLQLFLYSPNHFLSSHVSLVFSEDDLAEDDLADLELRRDLLSSHSNRSPEYSASESESEGDENSLYGGDEEEGVEINRFDIR